MKRILQVVSIMFLLLSAGCSSEDPQFRVRNERTDKANVQLQSTGGNTININDVGSGQTTKYMSASQGTMVVTAVIQNVALSPSINFNCGMDSRYTIVILASTPPTLRIDQ